MKLEQLGREETFTEIGNAEDDVGYGFKGGLLKGSLWKADVWVGMVEYKRMELRTKI